MNELTFSNLHSDGRSLERREAQLLGILADLAVRVAEAVLYTEVDFPIVELATQLQRWLQSQPRQDFRFDSMESATVGLIALLRDERGRWRVGSTETGLFSEPIDEEAVEEMVGRFVREVMSETRTKLAADVTPVVKGAAE